MVPDCVYPADLPLAELKTAEALLVTTARLFLYAADNPDYPCWWEGLWRATGDLNAAAAFEHLLHITALAAERPLDMRCPCCAELGEDEGRLLHLIALHQKGRTQAALDLLAGWLPSTAARLASAPAADLARMLARHRLVVPWRCPRDFSGLAILGHSNPGLALVQ